jgi:hypothetical protein
MSRHPHPESVSVIDCRSELVNGVLQTIGIAARRRHSACHHHFYEVNVMLEQPSNATSQSLPIIGATAPEVSVSRCGRERISTREDPWSHPEVCDLGIAQIDVEEARSTAIPDGRDPANE